MRLLRTQKNALFNAIVEKSLSPNQFNYVETDDIDNGLTFVSGHVIITYKACEDFKFTIGKYGNNYPSYYSPGKDEFLEKTNDIIKWDGLFSAFIVWLDSLCREIQHEDLWENMNRIASDIRITSDTNNEKFTYTQYVILTERMQQLKAGITMLSMPAQQIEAINSKLEQVLEQGKHLGRFDWSSQFVGTLINLMIALSVSVETGHEIWQLVKQFFNGVLLLQ